MKYSDSGSYIISPACIIVSYVRIIISLVINKWRIETFDIKMFGRYNYVKIQLLSNQSLL